MISFIGISKLFILLTEQLNKIYVNNQQKIRYKILNNFQKTDYFYPKIELLKQFKSRDLKSNL